MFDFSNSSAFLSILNESQRHAWVGDNAPDNLNFDVLDLHNRPGYRASPEETNKYDTVWLTENPIDNQGWRILIDSSIRLLKKSGLLVLRYVQNQFVTVINLKNFLYRKYGIDIRVDYEEIKAGEFLTVFHVIRKSGPSLEKTWTFGILTQGKKVEVVERFCRSVRNYGGPSHQIIIIGPSHDAYEPYNPTYIDRRYSERFSDICVKKNDIVEAAVNENICIAHDRYWLNSDFFEGFEKFGYDFEFLTIRQRHESGKNYPSYCAIDDRCHLIWGQIYECGTDNESWNRSYLNGGFVVGKRSVFLAIPFNPLIFHNQAEDVELAKEMENRSILPRINRFSSATTDVADHLTDAFKFALHSDYEKVFYTAPNKCVASIDIQIQNDSLHPKEETKLDGFVNATAAIDSNPVPKKGANFVQLVERVRRRRQAGASWKGIAFLSAQFMYVRTRARIQSRLTRADFSAEEKAWAETAAQPINSPEEGPLILKNDYSVKPSAHKGVNVILYAADAGGVVNLSIHYLRSLRRRNIPICIVDIQRGEAGNVIPEDLLEFFSDQPLYPTNIWCLGFPFIEHHLRVLRPWAEGRWNINFTHWELPRVPSRLAHNFAVVDSLIVDSEFVKDAISRVTDKPIEIVDPEIEIDPSVVQPYTRKHFGLPEKKVLFLLNWEFTSSTIRKNPMAGIKAFDSAFRDNKQNVALVMHVKFEHRHGPEKLQEYEEFLATIRRDFPHVIVLANNSYKYAEALALKNICDCYISLHRSEGYGMGCAEALALGKRCVMTGWSGNMELLKKGAWRELSYIVDAIPTKVSPADFPWVSDDDDVSQFWAEVKLNDAVSKLKAVYYDITSTV
jgi:hypothetical protein